MKTIVGQLDYMQGHLRYGHIECTISEEEYEKSFKNLSKEEQIEYLEDNGVVVCDDF
jgi:hypothetical protein